MGVTAGIVLRLKARAYLVAYLLLIFSGEIDKMIIFCADQERYGGLVETSSLPVPFLDAVEGGFAGEVEHEQNGHGVVADQWQHVDEFTLATQVPNRECDFGVAYGDCLFHKVHACVHTQVLDGDTRRSHRIRAGRT